MELLKTLKATIEADKLEIKVLEEELKFKKDRLVEMEFCLEATESRHKERMAKSALTTTGKKPQKK